MRDPYETSQVNSLPRRSAFEPHADPQAQAVRASLEAFCTRIQGRLEAATFADKQAILQLVIERIIVGTAAWRYAMSSHSARRRSPGATALSAPIRNCVRIVWTRHRCQVAPRVFGDRGFQPFVGVGHDELHAAQAAASQAAQELGPERLGLAVPDRHAAPLPPAVGVDANGNDHGHRHDVVVAPHFDVSGVQPDVGPVALMGRSRKAFTRSSISVQSRETWLLLMPSRPMALTRSSTERVEMPWM